MADAKVASTLDELCERVGVQRRWEAGGERHEASEGSVRAALRELGVPMGPGDGPLDEALRSVKLERWQRVVEPVSVAWDDGPSAVAVRVLERESRDRLELRVVLEDGGVAERRVEPDEVEWIEEAALDGRTFRRGRLPLPRLPTGWHDVTVRVGAREDRTRLIRAPTTTWDGPGEPGEEAPWRSWGAFLPLHALRSARDRGVGDLGDLDALARAVRERGGDFVGTLPLLPTFLGDAEGRERPGLPVEPSPYVPVSRLFWNELHLDVESAPGLEDVPAARAVLESADHRAEAERLRATDRAEHAAVMAHKRRVLEPLAAAVAGGAAGTGLAGPLETFADAVPGAMEYARFRAYAEHARAPWPEWPGEAAGGTLAPDDAPAPGVVYHLYVQWAMAEQMARLADGPGADLYLDLPLGCHPLGYDVWRHRDAFARGMSGGAPPDAFFAGGQDWGFPPLHPVRSRERGHAYFAASVRHLMGACRMLRLDHVMSLHRLFWVPEGGSPDDGVYVRYPSEELWAALCLESRRAECEVVGEDLGTVPAEVPAAMERRRARRMWVLPFEMEPGSSADEIRATTPPRRSVASLNTHDLPPFASFWKHRDADRDETDVSAADALPEALGLLARSPARLVLVNLEDLWGEETPQNRPGTSGPGNWTLRAARTVEELLDDETVTALLARVDRLRRETSDDDDTAIRGER